MTADTTQPAHAGTVPVYQKRALVPILGAALLLTCLLAGFAQAADTGSALNENGNLVTGIALASGQSLGSGDSQDTAGCGEYRIRCILKDGRMDWTLQPCYWSFGTAECERGGDAMRACENDFGKENVKAAVKETYCHWGS